MAKVTKTKAAINQRMQNAALSEVILVDGVMVTIPKGLDDVEKAIEEGNARERMATDEQFIAKRAERKARAERLASRRAALIEELGGVDQVKSNFAALKRKPNA